MKRTVPFQPLTISSDDDDEPSPSNGTKFLKRPKTEIAVVNPAKKVVTEGNLLHIFVYRH